MRPWIIERPRSTPVRLLAESIRAAIEAGRVDVGFVVRTEVKP